MWPSIAQLSLLSALALTAVSGHSTPKSSLEKLLQGKVDYCRGYLGLDRYTTRVVFDVGTKTVTVKGFSKKTSVKTKARTIRSGTKWITLDPVVETGYQTITPVEETVTSTAFTTIYMDPEVDTRYETITSTRVLVNRRDGIAPRHALNVKGYQKRHISSVCSSVLRKAKATKVVTYTKTSVRKYTSTKTVTRGVHVVTITKTVHSYTTVPKKTSSTRSTSTTTIPVTLAPETTTVAGPQSTITLPAEPSTTVITTTIYVDPPPPADACLEAGGTKIYGFTGENSGRLVTQVSAPGSYPAPSFCKPVCQGLYPAPDYSNVAWLFSPLFNPPAPGFGSCYCLYYKSGAADNVGHCEGTGTLFERSSGFGFNCFGWADCEGTYSFVPRAT